MRAPCVLLGTFYSPDPQGQNLFHRIGFFMVVVDAGQLFSCLLTFVQQELESAEIRTLGPVTSIRLNIRNFWYTSKSCNINSMSTQGMRHCWGNQIQEWQRASFISSCPSLLLPLYWETLTANPLTPMSRFLVPVFRGNSIHNCDDLVAGSSPTQQCILPPWEWMPATSRAATCQFQQTSSQVT